jgi:hypothetical protein
MYILLEKQNVEEREIEGEAYSRGKLRWRKTSCP